MGFRMSLEKENSLVVVKGSDRRVLSLQTSLRKSEDPFASNATTLGSRACGLPLTLLNLPTWHYLAKNAKSAARTLVVRH